MSEQDIKKLIEEAHHRQESLTLQGLEFHELDLSGTDFSQANLKGTGFSRCNLANCNFRAADLRGARLTGSNLNGANLTEARLEGADLSQAQLRGANLTQANVCRAILTKTDLSGADLSGADLTGIVFSPAYEHPELHGVLCDDETRWSENLDYFIQKHSLKAKELIQRREDTQLRFRKLEGEIARLQEATRTAQQKLQTLEQEKAALQQLVESQRQKLQEEEIRRVQLETEKARLQQLLESRRQRLEKAGPLGKLYLSLLNSARQAMGRPPLLTLPQENLTPAEQEIAERAYRLLEEVDQTLRQNQKIEPPQKSLLNQQARQVPENISRLLGKLSRLRRAKEFVEGEARTDLEKLEESLLEEIRHSATVLEGVLTSTMKLELAGADRPIERLLQDLQDSNERMRDLAEAYDEMKAGRL